MRTYGARDLSGIANFLYANRILRTQKNKGESFKENERELAMGLLGAPDEFRTFLEDFLAASGFKLYEYSSADMPGIPQGGTHFCLARDPNENVPAWLSTVNIYRNINLKESEPRATTRVWFYFIWVNMLTILYSSRNRPITNVSGYIQANFDKDLLVSQIKATLEEVRIDPSKELNKILATEDKNEVLKRTTKFIDFLCRISYLKSEKEGKDIFYNQTLLMALELNENYLSGLGYKFSDDKSISENLEENLFKVDGEQSPMENM